MQITADIDVRGLARLYGAVQSELARDTVNALNNAAFEAMGEIRGRLIPRVFSQPTNFTRRAPRVKKATLRQAVAEVFLATPDSGSPRHYLDPHITGGARAQKRAEYRLFDGFTFLVPARSAPRDAQGNLPRRTWNKILAQTRSFADPQQWETDQRRGRRQRRIKRRGGGESYFRVRRTDTETPVAHLTPGIWERIETGFGSAIRPVLVESRAAPNYQRVFPFDETVGEVFERTFAPALIQQFDRSIRKAQQRGGR